MNILNKLTDKIYYYTFIFNIYRVMKLTNHTWSFTSGVPSIIDIHNHISALVEELEISKEEMVWCWGIEVTRIESEEFDDKWWGAESDDIVYEIKYSLTHYLDKNG